MKVKPILFNSEMVRAILDGSKTVTRRLVKPQPVGRIAYVMAVHRAGTWGYPAEAERDRLWKSPYNADDVLYVRETWLPFLPCDIIDGERFAYRASTSAESDWFRQKMGYKWRPSIHMPREAARIWLRVTDVRVERLQHITRNGAIAEGCNAAIPVLEFRGLWDSTIKPADRDRYGWDANPWVWRIEFEQCEKPETGGAGRG